MAGAVGRRVNWSKHTMKYLTAVAKDFDSSHRKSSMEQARVIAESIAEQRATNELPVLADALEEAGYGQQRVLDQLRRRVIPTGTGFECLDEWARDTYRMLRTGPGGYTLGSTGGYDDWENTPLGSAHQEGRHAYFDGLPFVCPYLFGDLRAVQWMNGYSETSSSYNPVEDEGGDARARGESNESCPYNNRFQRAAWMQGWSGQGTQAGRH